MPHYPHPRPLPAASRKEGEDQPRGRKRALARVSRRCGACHRARVRATRILTLRGRLAWAHDFDPDRSIAATFQSLPGASFVVNGAAQAAHSALTTASIEMKWRNGWSASATFEGEFSSVTASHAGRAWCGMPFRRATPASGTKRSPRRCPLPVPALKDARKGNCRQSQRLVCHEGIYRCTDCCCDFLGCRFAVQ
jgi:hypothetical protein